MIWRALWLLFLMSATARARELNFVEAQLVRFSARQEPLEWLLPFRRPTVSKLEADLAVSSQRDVRGLLKDTGSKNLDRIEARLQQSYGKPYDAAARASLKFHWASLTQSFSSSAGAALLVTDPVFPDLRGFIFHDYAAHSALKLQIHPRLRVRPQLSYGIRRYLDRQYSVGDLLERKLDVNFNSAPYVGFVELNTKFEYELQENGELLFDLVSLPLRSTRHSYWETFLGYQTPRLWGHVNLWGGYSPLYGGHYDVSRTYRLGTHIHYNHWLSFEIFTLDRFYPGGLMALDLGAVKFEVFSFERSFDDYGTQRTRQYGLNFKLMWR